MLHVSLLGEFQAVWDGSALKRPSRRLVAELWAYLLVHREIAQSMGEAAAVFWPEIPEAQARGNLRRYLHFLHRWLPDLPEGPPWLLRDRNTLRWNPEAPIALDIARFESCLRRARRLVDESDPVAATAELLQAAELYRTDLLPEIDSDWVAQPRARLHAQLVAGLELLLRLQSASGDLPAALGIADRLQALRPNHEPTASAILWLLSASGQPDAALAAFERHRAALAEESGIAPGPEITALAAAIRDRAPIAAWRPGTFPASAGQAAAPFGAGEGGPASARTLPMPGDRFVGRAEAIAGLARLLSVTRLVTLVGVGGAGKSRLAIETGHSLAPSFADGVYWVDLAPLRDARAVEGAVASALGLRPGFGRPLIDLVVESLADRSLLIILDNCEHLVAASAAVAARLVEPEGVRVLATSRVSLAIAGESTWPVPALAVPADDPTLSAAELEAHEAVQLMLARVRELWPDYGIDLPRLRAMARICRRVEGIPLAIELAAARLSLLEPDEIAERLETSFALLRRRDRSHPERHATLTAAIDWGYQLLDPVERALLCRLSVFAGGFTLRSAQAVCLAPEEPFSDPLSGSDILDQMGRLIDQSFVGLDHQPGRDRRYRLLEIIRQFGREALEAGGDSAQVEARHAAHFLAWIEQAGARLQQGAGADWLDRIEAEQANLWAAMRWLAKQEDWAGAHRFCAAAWRYWHIRGHIDAERAWAEEVLAHPAAGLPPSVEGNARYGAGVMAYVHGDLAAAETHWRVGRALWEAEGAIGMVALLTHNLGLLAMVQGDFPAAQSLAEEALGLGRRAEDPQTAAKALAALAEIAKRRGDYDRAYAHYRESLELLRQSGPADDDRANVLRGLGSLTLAQARYAESESYLEEWLAGSRQARNRADTAAALSLLGMLAGDTGHYEQAEIHLREALTLWRGMGSQADLARTFHNLGELELRRGRFPIARSYLERSLAMKRRLDDAWNAAFTLIALADLDAWESRWQPAEEGLQEGLEAARRFGAKSLIARGLGIRARIATALGRPASALAPLRESLLLAGAMGEPRSIAVGLDLAAARALADDDPLAAARFVGAADALREAIRVPRGAAEQRAHEALWSELHTRAATEAVAAAVEEGRRTRPEVLVSTILGLTAQADT